MEYSKYNINNRFPIVFIVLSTLLFVYVLLRAYLIGITHDEAISYTFTVLEKGWSLTPNNHWINSVLGFIMTKISGYSELSLRMPNVLSFVLYAIFVFKLLNEFLLFQKSKYFGMLLFLFNPFLLEFFSLFRGYGLALSGLLASIYFFMKLIDEYHKASHLLLLFFSLFTIYSNYSFIFIVFAIHLTLFLKEFRILHNKTYLFNNFIFILLLVPAIYNMYLLSSGLYYGAEKGFIEATVIPLLNLSLPFEGYNSRWFLNEALFIVVLLISSLALLSEGKHLAIISLFASLLLTVFSLYHFAGILYPVRRTGMYFIIITVLVIVFCFDIFFEHKKIRNFVSMIAVLFTFCYLTNFIQNANFINHYANKREVDLKGVILLMGDFEKDQKLTLCTEQTFEPGLDYYRRIYKISNLNKISRKTPDQLCDYYYLRNDSRFREERLTHSNLVRTFKSTATELRKRK